MRAIHLRIGGTFLSGFVLVLLPATAQEVPVIAKPSNIFGQLTGARDKAKEDQVAKLFEGIRGEAKLPHLKRIGYRESLEQTVCTIALTGKPPKYTWQTTGFYKTANPGSVAPELSKVAMFSNLHPKGNPSYARYSVAVWSVKESPTGELMYWVGVQLFWSAVMEFFDYHFTDDIYYHNDWKKSIAALCRNE